MTASEVETGTSYPLINSFVMAGIKHSEYSLTYLHYITVTCPVAVLAAQVSNRAKTVVYIDSGESMLGIVVGPQFRNNYSPILWACSVKL